MTLLLPLLATALLHAAPGDTLFVQASSLNLRTKPKASANIRVQVPIGSSCVVVSVTPDGWAELKCPQGKGFGKAELLGPQAPDHSQLLAQGKEPGRPLPEALNLLQRAVTLKPQDPATQQAFRELFWRAEFDRLVRARTTDKTLKKESALPEGCGDTSACVKAALAPEAGLKATWEELRVQGTDIVHGQLFADGLFYLRSGSVDSGKRTLTVQLESLMVPSKEVLQGLGITGAADACEPQAPSQYSESLCGYEYEQNCGPDNCWDPYQSCKEASATRCQECKLTCKPACGECRMKCGTRNRQECVAGCIATARACEAECQEPVEAAYASCDSEYQSCSQEDEREWNSTCKGPCDRVYACVERCEKKSKEPNTWKCVDQCDNSLPQQCGERCLFRYQ